MPGKPDESTAKSDPLLRHLRLPERKWITLHVVAGREKGKQYRCERPRVIIGRRNTDLVLDDPQVSQPHCVVEINDEQVTLRDLDSTNGTFVNGRRTREAPLEHLSEFQVGSHTLVLLITQADLHTASPPETE